MTTQSLIFKPPFERYNQYAHEKYQSIPKYSSSYKDEPYPFDTQFFGVSLGRTRYATGRLKNKHILSWERTAQM